jgi:hypothetical protein
LPAAAKQPKTPPPAPKEKAVNTGGMELWNGITTGMNKEAVRQRLRQILPGAEETEDNRLSLGLMQYENRFAFLGDTLYQNDDSLSVPLGDLISFNTGEDAPIGVIRVGFFEGRLVMVQVSYGRGGPTDMEVSNAARKQFGDYTISNGPYYAWEQGSRIIVLQSSGSFTDEDYPGMFFFDAKAYIAAARKQKQLYKKREEERARERQSVIKF